MAEPRDQDARRRAEEKYSINVQDLAKGPPHEGELGDGLMFRTDRGNLRGILHEAPEAHQGVIFVCGARGGFGGPGSGTYTRLAETLRQQGITSLRLDYRHPNEFVECVLDLMVGISYFQGAGHDPVVLVGHSFGGATVIAAGASSDHVCGVVSLSPQTYGANMARFLSPRRLLIVHGKADTRLPFSCGVQIHEWAREPKELVLYEGAEHRLDECREELESLLEQWIPATLSQPLPETSSPL